MKQYGVYFSGRLKKKFNSLKSARKFAEEAHANTRVKTIDIKQLPKKIKNPRETGAGGYYW